MLPAGADRYLKLILLELNPFVTLIFFAKAPFFGCYLLKLMNAGEVDSIGVEVGFFFLVILISFTMAFTEMLPTGAGRFFECW